MYDVAASSIIKKVSISMAFDVSEQTITLPFRLIKYSTSSVNPSSHLKQQQTSTSAAAASTMNAHSPSREGTTNLHFCDGKLRIEKRQKLKFLLSQSTMMMSPFDCCSKHNNNFSVPIWFCCCQCSCILLRSAFQQRERFILACNC